VTYGAAWGPRNRFYVQEPGWFALVRVNHHLHGPGIALGRPLGATTEFDFVLSPDRRRLAVSESYDDGTRRIAVYHARTGQRLRALTASHHDSRPAWSPNGRWIAFWRDPKDPGDGLGTMGMTASIERVPARGGAVRAVVSRRHDVGPPAWGG